MLIAHSCTKLSKAFSYCNIKYIEILLKEMSLSREPKILLKICSKISQILCLAFFCSIQRNMEKYICAFILSSTICLEVYLLATRDIVVNKKYPVHLELQLIREKGIDQIIIHPCAMAHAICWGLEVGVEF